MPRDLVFITKQYPYGTGESFIEQEIEIAAQEFDKIYLIAYQVISFENCRKLPDNVKVIPLLKKGKVQKISKYIKYLFSKEIRKELIKENKNNHSLKEKRKLASFYLETVMKEDEVKKIMSSYLTNGQYILYTYWFNDTAYLGYRLIKKNQQNHFPVFISRAHGYDLYKERNDGNEFPFRKKIFERITAVYPCSDQGQQYLKQEYPMYAHKVERSYLGTNRYGEVILNKKDDDVFHIVTCSNLIPLKRVERLAETLCILEEKDICFAKKIKWTCIGEGSSFEKIRDICKSFKFIQYEFTGQKKNKEILKFYAENYIDIFINLSTTEGLPVSIMEAMSYGIPVIATNVGGTSEIVDNESGILIDIDFTNELLCDIICKINFMDQSKKDEMRKKALNKWKYEFQAEKNYTEFYNRIKQLQ